MRQKNEICWRLKAGMPMIIYCETIYDNLIEMGYSRILHAKKAGKSMTRFPIK